MTEAYEIIRADRAAGGHVEVKAGETVYRLKGYDYGLASDDTRAFGIEYISVTRESDGEYPGFTIPVRDLRPISSEGETA